MPLAKAKARMEYFVSCVGEFADAYSMPPHEAFDYLYRHKGMEFLVRCYEAEHTLSFADAVDDLAAVCRKNGGWL